jgi:hypothetical protein
MNQEYYAISVGFKLGQGVSSLNRIFVSLKMYKGNEKDEVISSILEELQDLINKLTI